MKFSPPPNFPQHPLPFPTKRYVYSLLLHVHLQLRVPLYNQTTSKRWFIMKSVGAKINLWGFSDHLTGSCTSLKYHMKTISHSIWNLNFQTRNTIFNLRYQNQSQFDDDGPIESYIFSRCWIGIFLLYLSIKQFGQWF